MTSGGNYHLPHSLSIVSGLTLHTTYCFGSFSVQCFLISHGNNIISLASPTSYCRFLRSVTSFAAHYGTQVMCKMKAGALHPVNISSFSPRADVLCVFAPCPPCLSDCKCGAQYDIPQALSTLLYETESLTWSLPSRLGWLTSLLQNLPISASHWGHKHALPHLSSSTGM